MMDDVAEKELLAKRRAKIEECFADPIFLPQPDEIEEMEADFGEDFFAGALVRTGWCFVTRVRDSGDDEEMIFTLFPEGMGQSERTGLMEIARRKAGW